jgi:hypothetical protein
MIFLHFYSSVKHTWKGCFSISPGVRSTNECFLLYARRKLNNADGRSGKMEVRTNTFPNHTSAPMKISKLDALSATSNHLNLRFEEQSLTSFSGLVIFQSLFARLGLYRRLARCFRHVPVRAIYPCAKIILLLIVHFLLGFRCLRQSCFYADDPMVLRVLGLKRLPSVSTISRNLSSLDETSAKNLETLRTDLVLDRLAQLDSPRITLDFDGSVIGTKRKAEGVAVGFNKNKKGQRSYYPLYCTVAQTGQVLGVLNRSGNVHDSNGARDFIIQCITAVRQVRTSRTVIEVRMDSAFFSDQIVQTLEDIGVRYTISVPFERFAALKAMIDEPEEPINWQDIDDSRDAFEAHWKPASWEKKRRFVLVRQFVTEQRKGPLQYDLFEPRSYQFDYKAVITNRKDPINKVVLCHEGRGSQEGIFAELKSESALAYVPTGTWLGNRAFMSAVLIAHNLTRELTMASEQPLRGGNHAKRAPLWVFTRIDTLRRGTLQRAGRLIKPQGKLTLSMSANEAVKNRINGILNKLDAAA